MEMKKITLVLVSIFITACNSFAVNKDIPALIVNPDQASRNELKNAVSSALNGADITLADNALTRDSRLFIERKQRNTLETSPVLGRDLGKPEVFQLVLSGSKCVLVQQGNEKRWALPKTRCKPVK